jgi:hypothetical protein
MTIVSFQKKKTLIILWPVFFDHKLTLCLGIES